MTTLRALLPLCLAAILAACASEPAKTDGADKADGADEKPEPTDTAAPAAGETGDPVPAAGDTTGEGDAGAAAETGDGAAAETGDAGETGDPDATGDGEATGDEAGEEDGGKKPEDKTGGSKPKADKADLELGKTMYSKKCKNCHADDGQGSEKFAEKVDHLPSIKNTKLSKSKVRKIIVDGVPDTKMKGYKGKLSDEEIDAVTAFVMTL